MNEESAKEKIAKLLRLAKSSNQHEAELAMQNAARLAAKHCIDLASCDGIDEVPDVIIAKVESCPKCLRREWRCALAIAQMHFHVTPVLGRGKVTFFGRDEDIEIAVAMHAFLVAECRKGLAQYEEDEKDHRRRMTPNKRDTYIDAWFAAVNAKLIGQLDVLKLEHSRLALVLADAKTQRDEAKNAHFGAGNLVDSKPLRKPTRRNVMARVAGYVDGRKTQLMGEPKAPKSAEQLMLLN